MTVGIVDLHGKMTLLLMYTDNPQISKNSKVSHLGFHGPGCFLAKLSFETVSDRLL